MADCSIGSGWVLVLAPPSLSPPPSPPLPRTRRATRRPVVIDPPVPVITLPPQQEAQFIRLGALGGGGGGTGPLPLTTAVAVTVAVALLVRPLVDPPQSVASHPQSAITAPTSAVSPSFEDGPPLPSKCVVKTGGESRENKNDACEALCTSISYSATEKRFAQR